MMLLFYIIIVCVNSERIQRSHFPCDRLLLLALVFGLLVAFSTCCTDCPCDGSGFDGLTANVGSACAPNTGSNKKPDRPGVAGAAILAELEPDTAGLAGDMVPAASVGKVTGESATRR